MVVVAMNVRTLVPALAVTCAALLAGCSGRDNEAPAPTANLPPATSTAERTPSSPTPTAVTQVRTYPNPQATGTFVYIVMVGVDRTTERFYPKLEVIAQDLRSGRITARIPFGGAGEYPLAASIAGERIIVATESRMVRFARDGSSELTLFRTSDTAPIQDLAVSPDGTIAAVAMACAVPDCPSGPAAAFVRVDSGAVLASVDHAALRAGGFKGYAWQIRWRDDGAGAVLKGGTGSEAVGGRALVRPDGSATVYQQPPGYGNVSPDGRLAADNTDQFSCMRVGGHAIQVVELDSGRTLRAIGGGAGAYATWEWSPDSRAVLYQFLPSNNLDDCIWTEASVEFWLLDLGTGVSSAIADVRQLHVDWYGARLVEVACSEGPYAEPVLDRRGNSNAVCRPLATGDADGDIFLGGVKIASWPPAEEPPRTTRPVPVGFLD